MTRGTVKFFNKTKGFGFVTPADGRPDIFLPAAAVIAAGVTMLKPGQQITFEQVPDVKGPKVTSLSLVEDVSAKVAAHASEQVTQVTVYCDAKADGTAEIVAAVRNSGASVTAQDYVSAPLNVDQLKQLSQMLSGSGQSLVRRYDPLFLALRLDDRFITDQDFWTAIVEHPALINGPVLTTSGRARVCKTVNEVRGFLRKDDAAIFPKPKTISPRIAAMLRGEVPPDVKRAAPAEPVLPIPNRLLEVKTRGVTKATAKLKSTTKPKGRPRASANGPKEKAAPRKTTKSAKKTKNRAKK